MLTILLADKSIFKCLGAVCFMIIVVVYRSPCHSIIFYSLDHHIPDYS